MIYSKKNIYIYKNLKRVFQFKNNLLKSNGFEKYSLKFFKKFNKLAFWMSRLSRDRQIECITLISDERLLKNHQLHACTDQSLLKQRPKNIDYATSTLIIYTRRLHKWFVEIVLLNFNRDIYLFLKTRRNDCVVKII